MDSHQTCNFASSQSPLWSLRRRYHPAPWLAQDLFWERQNCKRTHLMWTHSLLVKRCKCRSNNKKKQEFVSRCSVCFRSLSSLIFWRNWCAKIFPAFSPCSYELCLDFKMWFSAWCVERRSNSVLSNRRCLSISAEGECLYLISSLRISSVSCLRRLLFAFLHIAQ